MNQQELIGKLSVFKTNVQDLIGKISASTKRKEASGLSVEHHSIDEDYPNDIDDLPLTIVHDSSPNQGITFYETENSPLAKNANRAPAKGIDSFGEKDTFDFEEADDYQTNRDRKQNSDLSKRFYTGGLDTDGLDQ